MDIEPKSVLVYRTLDGRLPFDEWLRGLRDTNAVARILARIGRVRRGNLGDCKPVGEGVSELRVDYGPSYRVYFGQKGRTLVVLLWVATSGHRSTISVRLNFTGMITRNAKAGKP